MRDLSDNEVSFIYGAGGKGKSCGCGGHGGSATKKHKSQSKPKCGPSHKQHGTGPKGARSKGPGHVWC